MVSSVHAWLLMGTGWDVPRWSHTGNSWLARERQRQLTEEVKKWASSVVLRLGEGRGGGSESETNGCQLGG